MHAIARKVSWGEAYIVEEVHEGRTEDVLSNGVSIGHVHNNSRAFSVVLRGV